MTGITTPTGRPDDATLLTREFLILGLATMLYFFSMGAANPLLPKFVVDDLGGTEATAGLVMGTFAVAALLTRSGFGRIGGRRGARILVLVGGIVGGMGMLVLAVTSTVVLAVVGRMVLGASQAAMMTGATALAIDLAPDDRRGEAASYILMSFHLGLGSGPILGEQLLARATYRQVWLCLTVPMILAALTSRFLPARGGDPEAPPSPWIHPHGVAPGIVVAFGIVPFVAFTSFVPLYGREIGLHEVGTVFLVTSATIAAARLFLSRLPDALGPIRSGSITLVLMGIGAVTVALWSHPAGVYVAAALLAAGMALQTPSLIPVAVHGVPAHERASAMATFTMFMDLAVALAGPAIGLIVSRYGYRTAFLVAAAMALPGLLVLRGHLATRWRADTAATSQAPASGAS